MLPRTAKVTPAGEERPTGYRCGGVASSRTAPGSARPSWPVARLPAAGSSRCGEIVALGPGAHAMVVYRDHPIALVPKLVFSAGEVIREQRERARSRIRTSWACSGGRSERRVMLGQPRAAALRTPGRPAARFRRLRRGAYNARSVAKPRKTRVGVSRRGRCGRSHGSLPSVIQTRASLSWV
jgi:hypothetical protein